MKDYPPDGTKVSMVFLKRLEVPLEVTSVPIDLPIESIEPVSFAEYPFNEIEGISYASVTATVIEECNLSCRSDKSCMAFQFNLDSLECKIFEIIYWETLLSNLSNHLYIAKRPLLYIPPISPVIDLYYLYQHYDYLKGINDINNSIKSILQIPELVFEVYAFTMGTITPDDVLKDIEDNNFILKSNLVPIQFKLVETKQIPTEFIENPNDDVGLAMETRFNEYASFSPVRLNIFYGELEDSYGWSRYPFIGYNNSISVFLDYNSIADGRQRTITHEIGHWFGLHHTFEFGCYPGDFVDDTVPVSRSNGESIACKNTGYSADQNVMDYIEKSYLSPGQIYRMMIFAFEKLTGAMPMYENGIILKR